MPKFILICALCLSLTACLKESEVLSNIHINQAYGFATVPGAKTGAAFMVLTNQSAEDDYLITAQSNVANITEIHQNLIDPDDGTMMMRKVDQIDIPLNTPTALTPTGYHIMFIDLKNTLAIGQSVPVQLTFAKAGTKTVHVDIIAPGTKPK